MARAKSALITQRVGAVDARGRCARRPPAAPRRGSRAPARRVGSPPPARAPPGPSPRVTAPQPPIGWKTPYSYSRNERIENRLGHWNGDIPRYFDWNEKASRMRGSAEVARRARRRASARGAGSGSRRRMAAGRDVLPAEERRLDAGAEALELVAVVVQEPLDRSRVARRQRGDLAVHLVRPCSPSGYRNSFCAHPRQPKKRFGFSRRKRIQHSSSGSVNGRCSVPGAYEA